jgi:putative NADPH-quinone reductase
MSAPLAPRLRPPGRPAAQAGEVLVLLAHPNLHRSRVNRALAEAARGVDGVTVHDLYAAWPDHHIDVAHEQALCEAHRCLVWLHPMTWYSTPSLLKEWQDLVLAWGWAYGSGGQALRGKPFLQALSTGGPAAAYAEGAEGRRTVEALLAPIAQMAQLVGLDRRPPFVVHGAPRLTPDELKAQAAAFADALTALRDEARALPAPGGA